MTGKEEGLWTPKGDVSTEEVRHMQARVELFRATHVVGNCPDDFHQSPACAASWCRWLVVASARYASKLILRSPGPYNAVRQPCVKRTLPPLPGDAEEDEDSFGHGFDLG